MSTILWKSGRIIFAILIAIAMRAAAGEPSGAVAPALEVPAAEMQAALPEDGAVILEQARIAETVEQDYEQALEIYRELAGREDAGDQRFQAELGEARCLLKLGRYGESIEFLEAMRSRHPGGGEESAIIENLLGRARRRSAPQARDPWTTWSSSCSTPRLAVTRRPAARS